MNRTRLIECVLRLNMGVLELIVYLFPANTSRLFNNVGDSGMFEMRSFGEAFCFEAQLV